MKVSILGMGAFGIALTKILKKDVEVSMWTNFEDELKAVELKRENTVVLPNVKIDKKVELTTDLEKCVKDSSVIFMAVPAVAVREVANKLKDYITLDQTICIVTKGIERDTNLFMTDVLNECIDAENICVFAGPSFAIEVVNGANIGMVIASENDKCKDMIESVISTERLNLTKTSDIIGTQICSAIKNVFAIICAMLNGEEDTDSTRAALFTTILNDFRLVMGVLGGKEATVYSYAGIGDLLLTCLSPKSRNYSFGKLIGKGMSKDDALNNMNVKTVEGLYTLDAIYDILKQKKVEVRSINLLYDVVYNGKKVDNLLKEISN